MNLAIFVAASALWRLAETASPDVDVAPPPPASVPPASEVTGSVAAPAPVTAAESAPPKPTAPPTPAIVAAPALPPPSESDLGAQSRAFRASMLVQMRFQQTATVIQPGLTALVMQQSPSNAERTLQLIQDTARVGDGLRPRRLLLDAVGTPADGLSWVVRLDFAKLLYEEPMELVRWAYGEYAPFERLVVTAGIFDIPFSLFETMDEAEIELAERGPTHELLHHLGFAERDLGALLTLYPLREKRWLQATGGVMNGGADGGQSYRGPGLVGGRVVSQPVEHLQLGAGLVWRPRPLTAWWEEVRFYYQSHDKGLAYGTDLTLSFRRAAFRAEWIAGDRTDNDVMLPLQQRRGDARTFMSVWGMALVYLQVRSVRIIPALRGEFLDTDRQHPTGAILHVSAALNVYFTDRVRLLADVSRHFVQIGTRNWEYSLARYDTDTTIGVLQLQLRL